MKISLNIRNALIFYVLWAGVVMASGLFVQYYYEYEPCPLCIIQRYGFTLLGIISLIGLIIGIKKQDWQKWFVAMVIAVAGLGVGIASYQLHMQLFPDISLSCSAFDLDYLVNNYSLAQMLPKIFKGSGSCQEIHKVMGLPLPAWSLIMYLLYFVSGIFVLRKKSI